jgi:prepilin-type N-terminal cleavage/methylation domain-containing protein
MNTRRRADAGFTLIEVLAAMVIMALAVFPCLTVIREAEKNSFDAKFSELCVGKMRSLLSEIARTQKPGQSGSGDFSTMSREEGGDDRQAYANIRYEWQCTAVDLSLDITPANEMTDAEKDAEKSKKDKQDEAQKAEDADAAIDERFRARYVRMSCTYHLDNGEERQIIVETYIPPLPSPNQTTPNGDTVPPNQGTGGGTKGGTKGGGTKGGTTKGSSGAGTTGPGKGSAPGKGKGSGTTKTGSGN